MSAIRVKGGTPEDLKNQRIVILGAGSAGTGVAQMLLEGMMSQGLDKDEAIKRFHLIDEHGVLTKARAVRTAYPGYGWM